MKLNWKRISIWHFNHVMTEADVCVIVSNLPSCGLDLVSKRNSTILFTTEISIRPPGEKKIRAFIYVSDLNKGAALRPSGFSCCSVARPRAFQDHISHVVNRAWVGVFPWVAEGHLLFWSAANLWAYFLVPIVKYGFSPYDKFFDKTSYKFASSV